MEQALGIHNMLGYMRGLVLSEVAKEMGTEFNGIFAGQLAEAARSVGGPRIKVATCCSGTDAALWAIGALKDEFLAEFGIEVRGSDLLFSQVVF